MYDPITARFMQEDTYLGQKNDPLSLNLYTYCHNSPLMYWDPTGHSAEYAVNYNGQQLSAKSANDNMAQREIRKVLNKNIGTPNNPADLARINAGISNPLKKAPTVVYKTVTIAEEGKDEKGSWGTEPIFSEPYMSRSFNNELCKYVYIQGNDFPKEHKDPHDRGVSFALRHPFIADALLEKIFPDVVQYEKINGTHIISDSFRFAEMVINGNLTEGENFYTNAYRHVFWNATMAKKYGKKIAKEVADTHETYPEALEYINSEYFYEDNFARLRIVGDGGHADAVVDLLNNLIGIEIGKQLKDKDGSAKENNLDTARAVLDYYYDNGLWMTEKNEDGTYSLHQVQLSKEEYDKAIANLECLNEDGKWNK